MPADLQLNYYGYSVAGVGTGFGFTILITPAVIMRLVRKEGKKEKMLWETMYDISFAIGSVVIYVLFFLHIFGINLV
ncbi:MAG: hypothetical protein WCC36_17435 [Gammaproteobacteria bacterium]